MPFEFEGVPWLKPYFNGLIESYFAYLRQDAEQLRQGFSAMRTMVNRAREQRSAELSWIEARDDSRSSGRFSIRCRRRCAWWRDTPTTS